MNHRINLASSVTELQNHLVDVLSPVAGKYNLSLTAFGEDVEIKGCKMHMTETKAGKVFLSEAFESSFVRSSSQSTRPLNPDGRLEPAPISPHTIQSPAWRVLSGTVKGVYATRPEADLSEEDAKKTVIMAPMISTGVSHPFRSSTCPFQLMSLVEYRHEVLLEPHTEHLPFRVPRQLQSERRFQWGPHR